MTSVKNFASTLLAIFELLLLVSFRGTQAHSWEEAAVTAALFVGLYLFPVGRRILPYVTCGVWGLIFGTWLWQSIPDLMGIHTHTHLALSVIGGFLLFIILALRRLKVDLEESYESERAEREYEEQHFDRQEDYREQYDEQDEYDDKVDEDIDESADARALLGVSEQATRKQIKKAYHQKITRCHPDKVAHLGADHQRKAHEQSVLLTAAYEKLLKGDSLAA